MCSGFSEQEKEVLLHSLDLYKQYVNKLFLNQFIDLDKINSLMVVTLSLRDRIIKDGH